MLLGYTEEIKNLMLSNLVEDLQETFIYLARMLLILQNHSLWKGNHNLLQWPISKYVECNTTISNW